MYVTRRGDFFIVQRPWGVPDGVERIDRAAGELTPFAAEEFARWLAERYAADPVETRYWGGREMLEKSTNAGEPEATLYIRVPRSLKDRLEAEAKEREISLNAWLMRCVERCATFDPTAKRALVELWNEIGAVNAFPDGYTQEQIVEMMGSAVSAFEDLCEWLGYSDDQLADDLGSMLLARDVPHREPCHAG